MYIILLYIILLYINVIAAYCSKDFSNKVGSSSPEKPIPPPPWIPFSIALAPTLDVLGTEIRGQNVGAEAILVLAGSIEAILDLF